MKNLELLIKNNHATTLPVSIDVVLDLEKKLGFSLTDDYKNFLINFGLISFESHETYGLGVKEDSYLNVFNIYKDLSNDKKYPPYAIPLMELGDGQYYLYDNQSSKILLWATPNGGTVRKIPGNLEDFFINHIFS